MKIIQPLLFPGWILQERIRNLQHGACIVGQTFELVIEQLLKAERNTTDSTQDLCPDLIMGVNMIECKAFGNTRAMMELGQLTKYMNKPDSILYCFCNYKAFKPCKNKPTMGELIKNITKTIDKVYILDGRIVQALARSWFLIDGLNFRYALIYVYGRAPIERQYITIQTKFFTNLFSDFETMLLMLQLNPEIYIKSQTTRRITFKYNDTKFVTNTFQVQAIQEIIPF